MSGLEPIAALGLACNILQVVGIGRETVRLARKVYQDGELDPALGENAELLRKISDAIRTTATAAAARDKQLLNLADKCHGAARDLDEEVKFLHGVPGGKAKLMVALKVAAKTTWRKRRLDNLDRKLKETEAHLQTGLLARIFERTEKTGIDLSTLDAGLRSFVEEYRKGHTDTAKLVSTESTRMRKHVSVEVKQTEVAIRSHITQHAIASERSLRTQIGAVLVGATRQNNDIQLQARREKLLRSLKFERINERRNHVETSHIGTCNWVLKDGSDESGSRTNSSTPDSDSSSKMEGGADPDTAYEGDSAAGPSFEWDSFSDWLRSNETVYWISGKPGSGKSTLMKYILRDDRTSDFLHLWRPNPILISHFFWRPGTEMQQSIKGFLCSLLYQLLSQDTPSLDHLLGTGSDMASKDSDTDWSVEELQATLHSVICTYPQPIAMVLDGLDEVLPSDGTILLLNVIDQLRELDARAGIKLCLGSRREPILRTRLGIYPQLRLENLNAADLGKYAMENITIPSDYHIDFSEWFWIRHNGKRYSRENMPNRTEIKELLVAQLTKKAEGVFLWLCLTTKTVTKAIASGETIEDLEHRLDRLPGDLSQLYAEMWARNNADDTDHLKSRAAVYFRMALAAINLQGHDFLNAIWLTPFTMAIATRPELASLCFDTSKAKEGLAARLFEACVAMKRDVETRCFGLLECRRFGERTSELMLPWQGDEFEKLAPYVSPETGQFLFVHRTARDFLVDTETGRALLGFTHGDMHTKPDLGLLTGHLASCTLFRIQSPPRFASNSMCNVFFNMRSILETALEEEEKTRLKRDFQGILHLCERLFGHGYLFDHTRGVEAHGPDDTRIHLFYETVLRQHEFFRYSVFYATGTLWSLKPLSESLFAMARTRDLDNEMKAEFLYYALYHRLEEYEQLGPVESLLEWGCSPTLKKRYRQSRVVTNGEVLETPLEFFLESKCWTLTGMRDADPVELHTSADILKRFLGFGADLEEEIHIAFQFSEGLMRAASWRDLPGHKFLIIGYPASVVIGTLIRQWGFESHADFVSLCGGQDLSKGMVGQGRLIAILNPPPYRPGPYSDLNYFDAYPLEPNADPDQDLLQLVRLAELGLVEANGSPVPTGPDMQACLDRGLERVSCDYVSSFVRQELLHRRLNVFPTEYGWL
ncbi:hypothetical protein MCOR23_008686 [Pyricularia oryzae]|nr:hypothetical protein MCOR28_009142 [Pyricularia oryzae]KAI6391984.1 hypothetical protein MCOR23_008686 [Pyricularia oryzae]KAI6408364.1 hypothetical protein MCOR20_005456 [Pyricularia oryzae]